MSAATGSRAPRQDGILNDRNLSGKVAIVTGASRGIGRAIALRLASAGATIVLAARSVEESVDGLPGTLMKTLADIEMAGGKATAIACDVVSAESRANLIGETVTRLGRVDILVNNAGRGSHERIGNMALADIHTQIEQYVIAPLDLIRHAIPHMTAAGQGWIVNLGSCSAFPVFGYREGDAEMPPGYALYGGIKAAVHRMSSGLATELRGVNIAVNVVAPVSAIVTPGVEALGLVTAELADQFEAPEHIAEACLALVSSPPREQTGLIAFSYRYLDQIGRSTRSLDGQRIIHARP